MEAQGQLCQRLPWGAGAWTVPQSVSLMSTATERHPHSPLTPDPAGQLQSPHRPKVLEDTTQRKHSGRHPQPPLSRGEKEVGVRKRRASHLVSLCPVPRTQSWLVLSQDRCLTPMGSGDPALSHTSQLPPFTSNIQALELKWGRGGRGGESWGKGGRTHQSSVLGKSSQTWNSVTRSIPGLRGLPGGGLADLEVTAQRGTDNCGTAQKASISGEQCGVCQL